ncbi:MAG: TetR/AcrR family transcriptional regulator [Massilia sp.]|jgi:AcrR family transcriptional regulator|nr:TetR/AcrR family transcriptional regulator [Massilia sp.]MDB5948421.1 TetR/AcrR family transcriptional regulator [Massilia sp.]
MTLPTRASGNYGGVSKEERRSDRRARLVAAATKLYGEQGFRHTPIKALCVEAGLTERYFYESFSSSEELLLAAYHSVIVELLDELTAAARHDEARPGQQQLAGALLAAYFGFLKRDRHAARLILLEIRGISAATTDTYTTALRSIARQMEQLLGLQDDAARHMLAFGVVGGISLIALSWVQDGYRESIDAMVEVGLQLAGVLFVRA